MIWKPSERPASAEWIRSSRWARPWNVPIQRFRVGKPSSRSIRSRISAAALFVKVTASTCCAATPFTRITQAIRCTSTRVLPLPAPASTRVGLSGAVTAARCASFKGSMMSVTSTAKRAGEKDWPTRVLLFGPEGRNVMVDEQEAEERDQIGDRVTEGRHRTLGAGPPLELDRVIQEAGA